MKFAERLKEQRILNGYNQTYVAKYMQVSQVSISTWERGVKEPSYQALIDLAKAPFSTISPPSSACRSTR